MSHRHLQDRRGDVALILNTESRDRMPYQSVLLAETLRLRGGALADIPIYSFQPRFGSPLPDRTRARFSELGVIHIDGPFNTCTPHYGQANKVFIGAWAEATLAHEFLVVIDSDCMVLSEPSLFELPAQVDVAVAVEPFKVAGTDGSDENATLWDSYQAHLGLERPLDLITTRIDRQRIRAYYNAGLIVARREAGFFRAWLQTFEALVASGLVPSDTRAVFTEQIVISMTIAKFGLAASQLPMMYNYPMAWHDRIEPVERADCLDDIAVAHYMRALDTPTAKDPLAMIPGLRLTERDREISVLIRKCGVTPNPKRNPVRTSRFHIRRWLARAAKRAGLGKERFGSLIAGGELTQGQGEVAPNDA